METVHYSGTDIRIEDIQELPKHVGSKWSRFVKTIVCPVCGDASGHAGILADGRWLCMKDVYSHKGRVIGFNGEESPEESYGRASVSTEEAEILNETFLMALRKLGRVTATQTREYFSKERGYDEKTINLLIEKGYTYFSPEIKSHRKIRFKVSTYVWDVLVKHPVFVGEKDRMHVTMVLPQQECLLFPIRLPFEGHREGLVVDLRARFFERSGKHKYLWLTKGNTRTELFVRPKYTFSRGVYEDTLVITEGEFKAEVIASYMGYDSIGLTGGSHMVALGKIWDDLRERGLHYSTVLIASDTDVFTRSKALTVSTVRGVCDLVSRDAPVPQYLLWGTSSERKGIDDYIISRGYHPFLGTFADWWAVVDPSIKESVVKAMGDNPIFGSMLSREKEYMLDAPLDSSSVRNYLEGEPVDGPEDRIKKILNEFYTNKQKMVVDTSETGSGKSFAIAEHVQEILKAGAKRVVYMSQSPVNPPIQSMENWDLMLGRTPYGYVYDSDQGKYRERTEAEYISNSPEADIEPNCLQRLPRILAEKGAYEAIGHVCEVCPFKGDCPFIKTRKSLMKTKVVRSSFTSYNPIPGDFVILDEIATLNPITSSNMSINSLKRFTGLLYDCADKLVSSGTIVDSKKLDDIHKRISSVFSGLRSVLSNYELRKIKYMSAPDIRKDLDLMLESTVGLSLSRYLDPIKQYLNLSFLQRIDKLIPKKELQSALSSALMSDSIDLPPIVEDLKALMELFGVVLALIGGKRYSLSFVNGGLMLTYLNNRVEGFLDRVSRGDIKLLVLDASANMPFYKPMFGKLHPKFVAFQDKNSDSSRPMILAITGLGTVFQGSSELSVQKKAKLITSKLHKQLCDEYGLDLRVPGVLTLKKFEHHMKGFVSGHMHADNLGSNKYFKANTNVLYLMGVPLPNLAIHVAQAEVLYGHSATPGSSYYNGSPMLADAMSRELLKASLDSAYVQSIGRLRANRRKDKTLVVVMDEYAQYLADESVDISELLPEDPAVSGKASYSKHRTKQDMYKLRLAHAKNREGKILTDLYNDRAMYAYARLGGVKLNPDVLGTDERYLYRHKLHKRFSEAKYDFHDEFIYIDSMPRVTREEKLGYFSRVFAMDRVLGKTLYWHLTPKEKEKMFGITKEDFDAMAFIAPGQAKRFLSKAKHLNGLPRAEMGEEPLNVNVANYTVMPAGTELIDDDTYYIANWCGAMEGIRELAELVHAEGYDELMYSPPSTDEEKRVMQDRVIALDIETTRKDSSENRMFVTGYEKGVETKDGPQVAKDVIRLISITHIPTGKTYVFDLFKILTGTENSEYSEFFRVFQSVLDVSLTMGHNIQFDMHYLKYHYGLETPNPYCTMTLMQYLISYYGDSEIFPDGVGLASFVKQVLDRELPKEMQLSNWKVPTLTVEQKLYSAMDTRIYTELFPKIQILSKCRPMYVSDEGENNYTYRLIALLGVGDRHIWREMKVLVPLADMAAHGTPIDTPELERQIIDNKCRLDTVVDELMKLGIGEPTRLAKVYGWLTAFGIERVEELLSSGDMRGKNKRSRKFTPMFEDELEDADERANTYKNYSVDEASLLAVQEHLAELLKKGVDRQTESDCMVLDKGISLLLEFRSITKLVDKLKEISKYSAVPSPDRVSRVHATLNTFGTKTGRMASRRPNLQNLGRGKIREIIGVSAQPGRILVGGDLPQIELRIAARITGDQTMLKAFQNGDDLHKITASVVSGKPLDEVTKEERQMAKAVNFGFLYGMREFTFLTYAKNNYGVDITPEEAKIIRDKYFDTYKGIAEWHKNAQRQARDAIEEDRKSEELNMYTTNTSTIAGRNLGMTVGHYFRKTVTRMNEDGIPVQEDVYDFGSLMKHILNYQDQGTGADIIKEALIAFWDSLSENGVDAHVVNVIHDEILVECAEEDKEKVGELLREAMEKTASGMLSLPVPVEVSYGYNWGEVH